MEAGHLRENPQTPQQQETPHLTLQKADGPSFSNKQSSHQTKPNNKQLTSTGFKQQQMCTPFFSVHRLLAFARSINTLVHEMN